MSDNNLAFHLSWLLSTKAFVPSLPSEIEASLLAVTLIPSSATEGEDTTDLDLHNVLDRQRALDTRIPSNTVPPEPSVITTAEDMAKVRIPPTLARPPITTKRGQVAIRNSVLHDESTSIAQAVTVKTPSQTMPPIMDFHADAEMKDEDIDSVLRRTDMLIAKQRTSAIDTIDLTEDTPETSLTEAPPQAMRQALGHVKVVVPKFLVAARAGHKRKSEEMLSPDDNQQGIQTSTTGRARPALSSAAGGVALETRQEEFRLSSSKIEPAGFENIDQMFEEAAGSDEEDCLLRTRRTSLPGQSLGSSDSFSGSGEDGARQVLPRIQPQSHPTVSKAKGKLVGVRAPQHSTAHVSQPRRRRTIADSDDDEELFAAAYITKSDPRGNISSRPSSPRNRRVLDLMDQTPGDLGIRSDVQALKSTPAPSGTMTPTRSATSLYICDIAELPPLETFKTSATEMCQFALRSTGELRRYFASTVSEHKRLSKAVIDDLMETGVKSNKLDEECQLCKSQLIAFQDLMTARNRHADLSEERRNFKKRLLESYDQGEELDPRPAMELAQRLRDNEIVLLRLLTETKLNSITVRLESLKTQARREEDVEVHLSQTTAQKHDMRRVGTVRDAASSSHTRYHQMQPDQNAQVSRATTDADHVAADPRQLNGTYNTETLSKTREVTPRNMNCVRPNKQAPEYAEHDFEDDIDAEEEMRQHYMCSPPSRLTNGRRPHQNINNDNDDDRGIGEAANEMELKPAVPSTFPAPPRRQPLLESSGNLPVGPTNKTNTNNTKLPNHAFRTDESAISMRHPWSADVKSALTRTFKLRGFRPHQLDAINTTLAGKDVFVLMPTGGGKSLCYQLPAIVQSGRTKGVTIVISPLLSLMEDQVFHLQKLKIQAWMINGDSTLDERNLVMNALRGPAPESFVVLLYITPEMLGNSTAIVNALKNLHAGGGLARIVIDEAHCVSQWGHDFRPDYKALGEIRSQFRGVPVMALTATATENVKVDVMHNLNITGCAVFSQSFNRPNLSYEVRKKAKKKELMDDIVGIITTKYKGQSGIIYCLSRNKCEEVAQQLREQHNIRAHHYHAKMSSKDKQNIQRAWQANKYHIIVATIAFGMGIDKPDVRFVIHHSIPKSLEGYYQETGRAGRDGKRSGCYMFYGYQDVSILKNMIRDGEGSREQIERQLSMLRNMTQYCDNQADCRRVQVLAYFNEKFNKEECDGQCDNCNSGFTYETKDLSDYAVQAINLVQDLSRPNAYITIATFIDIFRGMGGKKIKDAQYDQLEQYGAGSELGRNEVERLFYRLVAEDALTEFNVVNKAGFANQYLTTGSNCQEFKKGRRRLKMQVRIESPNSKSKKDKDGAVHAGRKKSAAAVKPSEYPLSTNVSSPIRAPKRRILQDYKYQAHEKSTRDNQRKSYTNDFGNDEEDGDWQEDDDDVGAFEPIRVGGRPRDNSPAKVYSEPITIDERRAKLTDMHNDIINNFLLEARNLGKKLIIKLNLRTAPFSDTELTEMAINFTTSQQEMENIPGIDLEKVDLYAKNYIPLISSAQNLYQATIANQEQRVHDPNHQTVVDLVSDDEFGGDDLDAADFEADFQSTQEEQGGGEYSEFFHGPSAKAGKSADNVMAFNDQMTQARSKSRASRGTLPRDEPDDDNRDRYANGRDRKRRSLSRAPPRAKSASSFKKKAWTGRSAAASGDGPSMTVHGGRSAGRGGGGGRAQGNSSYRQQPRGGGGGGRGGIPAMPT